MKKAILSLIILTLFVMPFGITSVSYSQTEEATTSATATASDVIKGVAETGEEGMEFLIKLGETVIEFFVKYSFQVLGGVIVLIIGCWIGGFFSKKVLTLMTGKGIDITLSKFTAGTVKLLVVIFAIIVAMEKFGIQIMPLIAGLSVIGVGFGLALQGPLANVVAGITLIFTKPFKVGDIVEIAGGEIGEVTEIMLPRTELKTVDGSLVLIPNIKIVGEIMENFSDWKKVILDVGVGYKADVNKAIEIVKGEITKDKRVPTNQGVSVGIIGFGDSSVNLKAIFFCKQDDYWQVQFDINKNIFDALNAANIEIPFPQRDVHLFKEQAKV